jgi:GNAT superfamily N-acetyltransferase
MTEGHPLARQHPEVAAQAGPGPLIRDAEMDEISAVAELIVDGFAEFRRLVPRAVWRAAVRDWRDVEGRMAFSDLIVAEVDRQLAGTVTFLPSGAQAVAERWPSTWASIRALVVRPRLRGRGVGRALTLECLRRARASGIATVGLHTTDFMVAAQATYLRIGFRGDPAFDIGWLGDRSVAPGTPGSVYARGFRLDLVPVMGP